MEHVVGPLDLSDIKDLNHLSSQGYSSALDALQTEGFDPWHLHVGLEKPMSETPDSYSPSA